MRINPDNTPALLAMLSDTSRSESDAILQLSTGRRVHSASDAPAAFSAAVQNRLMQSQNDEFLQSVVTVRDLLSTADSALNSVLQSVERAVTLGIEGGNGTLSASDRKSLASEVGGIRDQVLSLANLSFRGSYIFAGTDTASAPFAADNTSPSGIRYDGNSAVNSVEIGEEQYVHTGLSGDAIFTAPGKDVFQSLKALGDALNANDPPAIVAATTQVRSAFDHIRAARVFYGNTVHQLEADEGFLNEAQLQAKTQENSLVAADPAEAVTQLQQAQFARDATLAAVARTQMLSLLDYLQ